MSEVTLTAAVRQNLLSLQSTADLIGRTQNRLSTGLRVGSALDDAVAYFQAKGLSDRASDFVEKKSGIDQGISTLTAATDAVTGIQNLVQQLKGMANNAKSATTTTFPRKAARLPSKSIPVFHCNATGLDAVICRVPDAGAGGKTISPAPSIHIRPIV